MVPKVAAPRSFPRAGEESPRFSTSSPTLATVRRFYYSHPPGCEVVPHYEFVFVCLFVLAEPRGLWDLSSPSRD